MLILQVSMKVSMLKLFDKLCSVSAIVKVVDQSKRVAEKRMSMFQATDSDGGNRSSILLLLVLFVPSILSSNASL